MSQKTRVLFIGEHPYGNSGNSQMLRAMLEELDREIYEPLVFSETHIPVSDISHSYPFPLITPGPHVSDWGQETLRRAIDSTKFDIMLIVGVDLWHYHSLYEYFGKKRRERGFKIAAVFPFDTWSVRQDWLPWIKMLDFPCVYSRYGYEALKPHVPHIRYYRPRLYGAEYFVPQSEEVRKELKNRFFGVHSDRFVFGFVGGNQVRKDPLRVLKAFKQVKKHVPNCSLFLHTNVERGVFNIVQYVEDLEFEVGDIIVKPQNYDFPRNKVPRMYNAIDCLVNASMQEGLSWTIIEAALCGTPVIATFTTAQMELSDMFLPVPCIDLSYVPMMSSSTFTHVESRAAHVETLVGRMVQVAKNESSRNKMRETVVQLGKQWVDKTESINSLLEVVCREKLQIERKNEILFMQHSAAGDVFMTTRCLRSLKERHGNIPLNYMTQRQFHDILKGNPYIDNLLEWDESVRDNYRYSYNPHSDVILPGHWGRNCNSILSDFYWKILRVHPHDFFIEKVKPEGFEWNEEYGLEIKDSRFFPDPAFNGSYTGQSIYVGKQICIVHTTGGDPRYRTYKYMGDVCEGLREKGYVVVQVGGQHDYPAQAVSYRDWETDRKSTRLNSSHSRASRMPSSA